MPVFTNALLTVTLPAVTRVPALVSPLSSTVALISVELWPAARSNPPMVASVTVTVPPSTSTIPVTSVPASSIVDAPAVWIILVAVAPLIIASPRPAISTTPTLALSTCNAPASISLRPVIDPVPVTVVTGVPPTTCVKLATAPLAMVTVASSLCSVPVTELPPPIVIATVGPTVRLVVFTSTSVPETATPELIVKSVAVKFTSPEMAVPALRVTVVAAMPSIPAPASTPPVEVKEVRPVMA